MPTHTYTHVHACTHMCTNTYMAHILIHTCAQCMHIYMYMCVMRLYMHTYMHAQTHVYIHKYMNTHIHIHMHIDTCNTCLLVAGKGKRRKGGREEGRKFNFSKILSIYEFFCVRLIHTKVHQIHLKDLLEHTEYQTMKSYRASQVA